MKRLRMVFAGILLTMPLFALNASSSVDEGQALVLQATPSLTGDCWIYWQGRWIVVPC